MCVRHFGSWLCTDHRVCWLLWGAQLTSTAHIKYIMNNMEHAHYTPQHRQRWYTLHSTKAVVHRDSRYTLTTFRTRRKWTRD